MQWFTRPNQPHHHRCDSRHHYGQRRQYCRLLPLYGHGKRRHGHRDTGRMDRCGQPRGHAHPVGQQSIGQRWNGSATTPDRHLDAWPVRRYGHRRGHLVHYIGRHALQWHHQRNQRDCHHQLIGGRVGDADAAFIQRNGDCHRTGSVCTRRSIPELYRNRQLTPWRVGVCSSPNK